jgi:hypothetical protein
MLTAASTAIGDLQILHRAEGPAAEKIAGTESDPSPDDRSAEGWLVPLRQPVLPMKLGDDQIGLVSVTHPAPVTGKGIILWHN